MDSDAQANIAMKALSEMFSGHQQPGKSRYSGIRYELRIQDGKIVFVPNLDDVAFDKAFDEALHDIFETTASSDIDNK